MRLSTGIVGKYRYKYVRYKEYRYLQGCTQLAVGSSSSLAKQTQHWRSSSTRPALTTTTNNAESDVMVSKDTGAALYWWSWSWSEKKTADGVGTEGDGCGFIFGEKKRYRYRYHTKTIQRMTTLRRATTWRTSVTRRRQRKGWRWRPVGQRQWPKEGQYDQKYRYQYDGG